jgi:hypothetical protein
MPLSKLGSARITEIEAKIVVSAVAAPCVQVSQFFDKLRRFSS